MEDQDQVVGTAAAAPLPTPVPVQAVTAAPATSTVINTVAHDLFILLGIAATIFVKNPQSQQKAAAIYPLLQDLLPHL